MRKILVILGVALLASGCSMPTIGGTKPVAARPWHLLAYPAPKTLAGFDLQEEAAVSRDLQQGGADSLIDAGRFYSVRKSTRLLATMEVAQFRPGQRLQDASVQQEVVAQIGSSIMRPEKVGDRTVYKGAGNQQLFFVWFKGRLMHVLVTKGIPDPGPLLTAALGLP